MAEVAKSHSFDVNEHRVKDDSESLTAWRDKIEPQHTKMDSSSAGNSEEFKEIKEEKDDEVVGRFAIHTSVAQNDPGGRCSNPEPTESNRSDSRLKVPSVKTGLVVPSAVRISPVPVVNDNNTGANTSTTGARVNVGDKSQTVPVVRPLRSKSEKANAVHPSTTPGFTEQVEASEGQQTEKRNTQQKTPGLTESGVVASSRRVDQLQQKEKKKRHDAQIDFPSKGTTQSQRVVPLSSKAKAATSSPGITAGSQPPTRHVQYASEGTGRQHTGRNEHRRSRNAGRAHSNVPSNSVSSPAGGVNSAGRRQLRGLSTGSGMSDSVNEGSQSIPPTPLFQRLVTEEVQELKTLARVIEKQNARLADLESQHRELQSRLEQETFDKLELERVLGEREREWAEKCARLEADRDTFKGEVKVEKEKNENWKAQVVRKEQDIRRMWQRKFDRGDPHSYSIRNARQVAASTDRQNSPGSSQANKPPSSGSTIEQQMLHHRSPQDYLATSGPVEAVRARNVSNSLRDFFGM